MKWCESSEQKKRPRIRWNCTTSTPCAQSYLMITKISIDKRPYSYAIHIVSRLKWLRDRTKDILQIIVELNTFRSAKQINLTNDKHWQLIQIDTFWFYTYFVFKSNELPHSMTPSPPIFFTVFIASYVSFWNRPVRINHWIRENALKIISYSPLHSSTNYLPHSNTFSNRWKRIENKRWLWVFADYAIASTTELILLNDRAPFAHDHLVGSVRSYKSMDK